MPYDPLTGWDEKPPFGVILNVAHALCPDHCWPFLDGASTAHVMWKSVPLLPPSSAGDLIAGGSSWVTGGQYGKAVRHTTMSDMGRLTADSAAELDKVVGTGGGFTMLIAYRKTDGTVRTAGAVGTRGGSDGERVGLFLPFSDGNTYWHYGHYASDGELIVPTSSITFGDDLWCATTGPRGMELWQNGVLLGSNGNNPSRATSLSYSSLAFPPFEPGYSDFAELGLVMTWRRQLTTLEVAAITAAPYQVFGPPNEAWRVADTRDIRVTRKVQLFQLVPPDSAIPPSTTYTMFPLGR